jgi:type I restriction enzyme M protein
LNLSRNLGKNNPLNETDLADFVNLSKKKAESANSWAVKMADVDTETYDLSVKNPNKGEENTLREPIEILKEMKALDEETSNILNSIREML